MMRITSKDSEVLQDYRSFDSARIAGEFYGYFECNEFNSVPFVSSNMMIWDNKGEILRIPSWEVTNLNPMNCNGTISFDYPDEVTIQARA